MGFSDTGPHPSHSGSSSEVEKTRDMLGREFLTPLLDALAILEKIEIAPVGEEEIAIQESLGRIPSRPIVSPEDLPPDPRSTVDGFAVRAAETFGAGETLPAYLDLMGEIVMGEFPDLPISPGRCMRIATGGFLPPGADAVVMLEQTVDAGAGMIEVLKAVGEGENVIQRGEDVRAGETLLSAGETIRPAGIGLFSGLGIRSVWVRRRIRVGIISTGDEIVPAEAEIKPGKIREVNGPNLVAMVLAGGNIPTHYGIVRDEEVELIEVLRRAISENDIVVFSGGSSVGARDVGQRAIEALGPPGVILHGVAMKPGKPILIGLAGKKPVFGLPGHPVAVTVGFDVFVRPVMRRLAGLAAHDGGRHMCMVKAVLARNVGSAPGRTDFIRVRLAWPDGGGPPEAHPLLGKSGVMSSMIRADGYLVIEESRQGIQAGETVDIFPLFSPFFSLKSHD